jgi:hypothetical protein
MNGRKARELRAEETDRVVARALARIQMKQGDLGKRWVECGDSRLTLAEYSALRKENPKVPFPSLQALDLRMVEASRIVEAE